MRLFKPSRLIIIYSNASDFSFGVAVRAYKRMMKLNINVRIIIL